MSGCCPAEDQTICTGFLVRCRGEHCSAASEKSVAPKARQKRSVSSRGEPDLISCRQFPESGVDAGFKYDERACPIFVDASNALAQRNQEDCAFSFCVRREEADDIIVVEREAGCSQVLRVGRDIQLAAKNTCLQLNCAVTAVTKALEDFVKISQEEHGHAGVGRQLLLQAKVAGNLSQVAVAQQFQCPLLSMIKVGSTSETLDGIHDQIHVVEL